MDLDINSELIHKKVDEYIILLKKTGLVTDKDLLGKYKEKLHSLKFEEDNDLAGDAMISDGVLKYSCFYIISGMILSGIYYFDEVLFHEFSHVINSLHKIDNVPIKENIEDQNIINQNPFYGVLLIDEFVSQSVAQSLVLYKYNSLSEKVKRKYSFNQLSNYQKRNYTTYVTEPPYIIITSLSDYPEYDALAQSFIKKYYDMDKDEFIKKTINEEDFYIDKDEYEKMYADLCYLSIIVEALFYEDNKKKAHEAFKRILKK